MEEANNRDDAQSSRRLALSREDFDDYLVALTAKLRRNVDADRVLSGEIAHPLIRFQQINANSLRRLNVMWVSPESLFNDPVGPYTIFIRQLTDSLIRAPAPIPDIDGLNDLQAAQAIFRRAETHIYSTIVDTLRVGKTMHYARQVAFGAGQQLLRNITEDNRQITTRSLMAVFSALFTLSLGTNETFEDFDRHIGLLIQRLQNWRPPVVLPEQLLLYCALRALPAVPYGPVRHIILATPNISYYGGMAMLRDVANTGGELIASTLGSASSSKSAASVLCAPACNDQHHHPRRQQRQPRNRKKDKKKVPLYKIEGPCKHHGPDSKHATSECKDPTLSRH